MKIRVKTTTVRNRRPRRASPAHWMAVGTLAAYTTIGSSRWAVAAGAETARPAREARPRPSSRCGASTFPPDRSTARSRPSAPRHGLQIEAPAGILKGIASPGVTGVFTRRAGAEAGSWPAPRSPIRFTGPARRSTLELRGGRRRSRSRPGSSHPRRPNTPSPLRDIPQTITVIPAARSSRSRAPPRCATCCATCTGISIQAGEGGVPAGDNLSHPRLQRPHRHLHRRRARLRRLLARSLQRRAGGGGEGAGLRLRRPRLDRRLHQPGHQDAAAGPRCARRPWAAAPSDYKRGTLDVNQPLEGSACGQRPSA